MKIETEPRDDHQVTMIVELEIEKLDGARKKAARKIAEKVKISGFRPGKAPYDVVRRLYGDSAITEEAVEILVDEIYPEAVKEANIDPSGAGQLEKIESLEPPKFIFTVPLKPSVKLGDYQSVRLPYEFVSPDAALLDEEINNLRRMYAKTESVERPVQDGDYVLLDVTGQKSKAAESESPLLERKGFAIVIRSDEKENEWPFPGFSTNLIGLEPGQNKEFSHKYPKTFTDETLAGENVKFSVLVKTIRSVNMPELDDEFAKKTGLGQNVEELRKRMQDNIELEAHNIYDDQYYENLLDLIKQGSEIKYPPQVLDHELEHVLEDVERRLKNEGIENLDAYFTMLKTDRETFINEQARPTSIKRLERGLVMDELARVEKIEIENEALEAEFNSMWANLAINDEEFAKKTKNGTKASRELIDAVAMDSANRLVTRRVLDRIKEIAIAAPAKKSKKAAGAKLETADETPVEVTSETEPAPKKKAKKKSE